MCVKCVGCKGERRNGGERGKRANNSSTPAARPKTLKICLALTAKSGPEACGMILCSTCSIRWKGIHDRNINTILQGLQQHESWNTFYSEPAGILICPAWAAESLHKSLSLVAQYMRSQLVRNTSVSPAPMTPHASLLTNV